MRFRLLAPLALVGVVAAGLPAGAATLDPVTDVVTELTGRYIVTLKSDAATTPAEAASDAAAAGADVSYVYEHALLGYAATLPQALVTTLLGDPDVASVEPDRVVRLAQSSPPYGLDRLDQRALPLDGSYEVTNTGSGVTAYVVDTGIRPTHADFGGRAVAGYDALGGNGQDCNGHGTHVAGTIGGTTHGVAKQVRLVGVRVLDCTGAGATSGVVAGIDWITAHHQPGQPAVANLSLGSVASSAVDAAVERSIADGISFVAAAGNSRQDACSISPARVPAAITVGASDSRDRMASFSNYGSCVDLFAPGVSIPSAWHTSDSATTTLSGTSMASPHAAGAAALYLDGNPSASPAQVAQALDAATTKGAVSGGRTGGLLGTGLLSTSLPAGDLLYAGS